MSRFEIIKAQPWHCGTILRHLRAEHREAVARMSLHAHRELRDMFDQSPLKRAWAFEGRLVALAGVSGTLLSPAGFLWLAMTEEATKHPLSVVQEAKRFIADAMVTKTELATTILGGDEAAKRLAIFLGFHSGHEGMGRPAYSRGDRRTLSRFVENDPDIRIPVGNGYVIALGYHPDTGD